MHARCVVSLICAAGLISLAAPAAAQEGKVSERVYELRTYTTLPGRLQALHKRFADHTMKLFEKHGMKNEGYWSPTDEKLKDTVLIYIISHDSMAAAEKSWAAFQADPDWQKVRAASEADGKILAKAPDKVFMTKVPWAK
jgi:NIPSNAP